MTDSLIKVNAEDNYEFHWNMLIILLLATNTAKKGIGHPTSICWNQEQTLALHSFTNINYDKALRWCQVMHICFIYLFSNNKDYSIEICVHNNSSLEDWEIYWVLESIVWGTTLCTKQILLIFKISKHQRLLKVRDFFRENNLYKTSII